MLFAQGGLPYKTNGDARHLALGCKLQILVSLRVFGMESHYICPFRYRLVLCLKKFTKHALTLTTQKSPLARDQFKLEPHPHWSPLGVNLNFPTSIPVTFTMDPTGGELLHRSRPHSLTFGYY